MTAIKSLPDLIAAVSATRQTAEALQTIAQAALDLTTSRHAMLAVLDEEDAVLKLQYGAGEEFEGKALNQTLNIDRTLGEGIIAYVAATGEAMHTGNVSTEPRYRQMFVSTVSELAIPIKDFDGRIQAVLNIESDRPNAFDSEAREICSALASLVAMVLDRSNSIERESALIEIGQALDNSLTEEALVDQVIHVAGDVLQFQACSVFLHDERSDTFLLKGSSGPLKKEVGRLSYSRGEGFTGWVCDSGEPILLHDPQSDPRWRGKYVEFPSEQIASFLAVPIVFRNKSIGAIRVLRRKSKNPYLHNRFTAADQNILVAIAEQVASGLENIRNMERIVRSERMIAWGELSAKSSHMIGNRVFALKGDINELDHLLGERQPNLDEIRELQKSLATNVTRIEEILQDFRDFLTATQISRESTNLNALIKETVDEVFPRMSRVQLELSLSDDLPPVLVDGKKLRRAISELIENSFNYMQEGSLCIASRVVEKSEYTETRLSHISQFAEITIEDTGPGVEDEAKATIFQPFFSKRVKGMGLGLSIVKGIVDAHGGEVFEAGRLGHGARFVILLPVADRP